MFALMVSGTTNGADFPREILDDAWNTFTNASFLAEPPSKQAPRRQRERGWSLLPQASAAADAAGRAAGGGKAAAAGAGDGCVVC
jgi:hypothetical protein